MRSLRFDVNGQKLTCAPGCDFSGLVRGTSGYLRAAFATDGAWSGCKRAAAFYTVTGKEHARPVIDGECEIPAEVLGGPVFGVRLVGMREDYKITTNIVYIEQEG